MFSKLSSIVLVAFCTFATAVTARPMEESTTAGAAAVEANGKGGVMPAPNVINLVDVCIDLNFVNCFVIFDTVVPTGCINLPTLPGAAALGALENSISSTFPIAGIQCTLFADLNCGGRNLFVGGNIPDLSIVGFNDIATSLSCVAN